MAETIDALVPGIVLGSASTSFSPAMLTVPPAFTCEVHCGPSVGALNVSTREHIAPPLPPLPPEPPAPPLPPEPPAPPPPVLALVLVLVPVSRRGSYLVQSWQAANATLAPSASRTDDLSNRGRDIAFEHRAALR